MTRLVIALSLFVFLGVGCTTLNPSLSTEGTTNVSSTGEPPTLQKTIYTSFVINVHDFSQPEKSIATLHHLIDLHEAYDMPVDMYLTDAMVQIYEEDAPELIERLKTSPQVAVSYHLRPPTPYYSDFHEEWFAGLTGEALEEALYEYETHRVDLVTGKTTEEAGGYQHLKDVMGYAPYVVTQSAGPGDITKALANIYKEMGARFTLRHKVTSAFGEMTNGLYLRPEDVEVKVYNPSGVIDAGNMLTYHLEGVTQRPAFVNLKWHDNNFFSSGTNWAGIYYAPDAKGTDPLNSPYDLSLWTTSEANKSAADEKQQWDRYEAMLDYVKNHPELYTAVNSKDVLNLLEQ
ncbi:MAG: hypothetical protein AAB839_00875 [Patescibacteria group bacterium]